MEETILDTAKATQKPRRKGRRSREETNKIRAALGLTVKVAPPKRDYTPPAILPEKTKAKSQEILAAMLTGKSTLVVKKVMDKALDDNDSDQMACLKLLIDRMIPTSYFEKENKGNKGITIQIMGVGEVGIKENDEEPIEAEYVSTDEYVEEEPIDG
jgi:hypothetical protein